MACECKNDGCNDNCNKECCKDVDHAERATALVKELKLSVLELVRFQANDMMHEEGVAESNCVWERAIGVVETRIKNGKY